MNPPRDGVKRLVVSGLSATRGSRVLFADCSFTVAQGEVLSVRGANGSGKSTLLRILAGLSIADSGQVVIEGLSEMLRPLHYWGHASGLKDELTAMENIEAALQLEGQALSVEAMVASLAKVGLLAQRRIPARFLSQGQRRRILMAQLVLTQRPVWLLDEPTAALDTEGAALFASLLDEHAERGGIAVVATHLSIPVCAANCLKELALDHFAPRELVA